MNWCQITDKIEVYSLLFTLLPILRKVTKIWVYCLNVELIYSYRGGSYSVRSGGFIVKSWGSLLLGSRHGDSVILASWGIYEGISTRRSQRSRAEYTRISARVIRGYIYETKSNVSWRLVIFGPPANRQTGHCLERRFCFQFLFWINTCTNW